MMNRQRAAKVMTDAAELINGERAQNYGEPQKSFNEIAMYWSLYLDKNITAKDVGKMMILMKLCRDTTGQFHRDNFVDICGYAGLVGSDDGTND